MHSGGSFLSRRNEWRGGKTPRFLLLVDFVEVYGGEKKRSKNDGGSQRE